MTGNSERDTFVFYPSFLDGIELLSEQEQLKAYRMIAYYGIYGEVPQEEKSEATVVLYMAMPSIDTAKKNRKNGAKGGRPSKKQQETDGIANEKPLVKTYEDENVNVNVNADVNVDGYADEDQNADETGHEPGYESKCAHKAKERYGTYHNVLLRDTDLDKLKQEFPSDYQERIERLSEYMASTGKTYKDHLATIRSWAKKNERKPKDWKPEFGLVL